MRKTKGLQIRMRLHFICWSAFFVSCCLLFGCKKNVGTEQDNAIVEEEPKQTSYRIGVSVPDTTAPYYEALLTTIRSDAEENHCTVIVCDAKGDAKKQNEQLGLLAGESIDGLIFCPADDTFDYTNMELVRRSKKDNEAVPVVAVGAREGDTRSDKLSCDAYIGADDFGTGTLCGEDLVKRKPDGGTIILVEDPDVPARSTKMTGFEQATAGKGFAVAGRFWPGRDGDYEEEIADLVDTGEIDAIICAADTYAIAVDRYLIQNSSPRTMIYGAEGSPDLKRRLASAASMIEASGGVSVIQIGKKSVEVVLQKLSREKTDREYTVEGFLIDRENVEVYGTDGWQ